jgi:hypothetical protein
MHEVTLGGKTFISVKRAAEITGYTRDYLGQLARGGKIESQRVGRSWYVNIESLSKHQEVASSYEPTPPEVVQNLGPDVIVSLDGLEYISSKRASQISQYSQDYVTQLAREGKIHSKSVGGRWFIAREELLTYKKASDEALARAQIASVGLQRPVTASEKPLPTDGLLTYAPHPGDLLPRLAPVLREEGLNRGVPTRGSKIYDVQKMAKNIDISGTKTEKTARIGASAEPLKVGPVSTPRRAQSIVIKSAARTMSLPVHASVGVVAPIIVACAAIAVAVALASSVSNPNSRVLSALGALAQGEEIRFDILPSMDHVVDAIIGKDLNVKNSW